MKLRIAVLLALVVIAVFSLQWAMAFQSDADSERIAIDKVDGYAPKEGQKGIQILCKPATSIGDGEKDVEVDLIFDNASFVADYEIVDAAVFVKPDVLDDPAVQPYLNANPPKDVTARFLFPKGSKYRDRFYAFYMKPRNFDISIDNALSVFSKGERPIEIRALRSKFKPQK